MSERRKDWSYCYWVLLVNQLLVVGILTLISAALVNESYQACRAADLELPALSNWYFLSIGPGWLILVGLGSIVAALAFASVRQRFISIIAILASTVSCVVFLCGALISSMLPLLVTIRNSLPPESRW